VAEWAKYSKHARYTRWSPKRAGGPGGGAALAGGGGGLDGSVVCWPRSGYTPVVPSPAPLPLTGLFRLDDPVWGVLDTVTDVLG
jgi:hypothetical protein